MAKKKKIEENASLLNIISPIGMKFEANQFVLGENYCKGYGAIKYPPNPDYGWLTRITNIPSTMVSFTFTPNNGEILENINKNVTMLLGQANSEKEQLKKQRAQKGADEGMNLLRQIDENGESVGELAGTLIPLASDKETLKKVEQKMRGACAMANLKVRPLTLMQKHAMQHVAPFYTDTPLIHEVSNRVMPLRSFIGGFPFSSSGLNDNAGCYIAKDAAGGLVVLDVWLRENDRTNSNFVIMGVPGTGKSAGTKHLATSLFMLGTKFIFIDPESEYKDFCKNLGGNWLDAGGDVKSRVNPLQIMPIPRNDIPDETEPGVTDYYDKDQDKNGLGNLALYIKHLEVFFSIYIPSLTDKHKAILKMSLIELYKDFGIDWDTDASKLRPEDFPIMTDLQNKLKDKQKELYKEDKDTKTELYEDLILYLEDAANGADAALWNGPTTLETSSNITVLHQTM